MTSENEIKRQVSDFYDQVGWQEISAGVYQNAQYEDLRPVAREYIHRCHLRVKRYLPPMGRYFLDAGCGPIQYPEYLTYSEGYRYRVCADISMVAVQEARKRIGDAAAGGHGLFVVCDIANLPFAADTFDGVVSLHTIHHLPVDEHPRAYGELHRVMAPHSSGVVVNGWSSARLANLANRLLRWAERRNREIKLPETPVASDGHAAGGMSAALSTSGENRTFTRKTSAAWFKREIASRLPAEIRVWRTFSVKFLRAFIHPKSGGRWWLRLLYWLEERLPRFLGENGQYPLIVMRKK